MALSATFTANFTNFYDAVDKAEVKLQEFGGGAEKANVKLNALGKDVPKNLKHVEDATKQADKASIDWMGSLTKMAGVVGIAFSVDAIAGFVGGLFDTASAIKDMSAQWGVSTKAVQQWTAAAKGSGVEAKTVGNSVQFMTGAMAEGSDKYRASLEQLGLSYEKLRKLPLEEQYRQVIEAIRGVEDGTMQLDVAIGLLGPNAKQMIGAIRDGFIEAADKQNFMADTTIRRLTEAQAKWKSYYEAVTIYSADAMSAAIGSFERMTKSWGAFFSYAKLAIGVQTRLPNLIKDATKEIINLEGKTESLVDQMLDLGHATTGTNRPLKTQAEIDADLAAKKARLAKATADEERAQEKLKRETEALTRKLEAEDEKLNDLINSFGGSGGKGAIGKAEQYLKAISMAIPIEQMSATAKLDIHKAMDAAIVSYQAAGQMAPKVMYDIWLATKNTTEGVIEFSSRWLNFAHIVAKPLDINLGPGFQMMAEPGAGPLERFGSSISRISIALGDIGKMSGGTFGEIAGAIGGVAGGLQAGALAAEDFDKALANFKPGKNQDIAKGMADTAAAAVVAASAFLQMTEGATVLQSTLTGAAMGASLAPGPYMAYGAAIGAVVGYVRGLHTAQEDTISQLNKMKYHIAEAAGGWDALAKAAENAGAMQEYYALHNATNAQEIQWAAEALGKQLEFQATALEKVNEVAERYGITLEELGPAMQRSELDKKAQQLYHDWEVLNGAGLETVVITEKMGAEMSAYINQAEKMGTDVPIAMKPMIEAMIKAGTLTDENGVAFEDLESSGISFAMTMSDGFKAMIEEVKKLTDAISRGLGLAIKEIPAPEVTGTVRWHVEGIPQVNDRPGGGLAPEYAKGTDGFKNFGAGTPVILHGWEAVVPRGDAASLATVAQSSGSGAALGATSVVINAQGAFFQTPADLQRLADRVGDALTAKYSVMGKLRAAV